MTLELLQSGLLLADAMVASADLPAGETVTFSLREATPEDRFEIFPRHLERCDPERARLSPVPLQWLNDLERETQNNPNDQNSKFQTYADENVSIIS